MPSLAEINIFVNNYDAMKITVLSVVADDAYYPRLRINAKYKLKERPDRSDPPLKDYELIDLKGELRLSERQDTIGTVGWIGRHHDYRSANEFSEPQLSLFCDLDFQRIEKIEQFRDGKEPVFWIELWPTFAGKGPFNNIDSRAARIAIPRNKWMEILDGLGYGSFDVIEIPRGDMDFDGFEKVSKFLNESHKRLHLGDYDGCLSNCRMALESMAIMMPKRSNKYDSPFKEVLCNRTNEDRSKEYTGIISRVTQLTQASVHEFGADYDFTRAEVRFIQRSTENIMFLMGNLRIGGDEEE